ncbi:MAG: hypothetical protein GOMPHAMPRED_002739 [Gomphillus americanus]|uniref:Uncharacterized protein n=1 Tax=Gomphillus americanus TaxID=1940652 RepID=A0A8H3FD69_9LECA|nr:MAG: hypothetical protein GOMPHAMPRED_002739 [Gomphillus americanus]
MKRGTFVGDISSEFRVAQDLSGTTMERSNGSFRLTKKPYLLFGTGPSITALPSAYRAFIAPTLALATGLAAARTSDADIPSPNPSPWPSWPPSPWPSRPPSPHPPLTDAGPSSSRRRPRSLNENTMKLLARELALELDDLQRREADFEYEDAGYGHQRRALEDDDFWLYI